MKSQADSNRNRRGRALTRRQLLALSGLVITGIGVASGYVYRHNEANDPVVDRVEVPVRGLKTALEGFTIAVLSDFHLYPFTSLELINRAIAMSNALQPDLAVLLGDYVWRDKEAIFDLAPALAALNARHGVYAALGNHDHWTDAALISAALRAAGLSLLRNDGVPISQGSATLYLAGLDDGWSGRPDLHAAMEGRPPEALTVLMVHEPDLADRYSLDPRIALQLSGHSHGGQVRLPRVGALVLPYLAWKYDMGLYRVRDMWLYTNRGIGVTSEPVRYNCPPEITQIILTAA